VTAIPGTVPAGQTVGVVGLKADAASHFDVRDVQVVGKGHDGQAVAASRTVVFAQQTISTPGFGMSGTIPSYGRPFIGVTAAVTRPGPIVLNPGAAKLVVPQGGTVEAALQIVWQGDEKAKYQLDAFSPPTGLSVAATEVGEGSTRATVKVKAAADAPLGPLTLGLVAHPPGRSDAGARQGDGPQSPPPAVAAALIAVEVVHTASPK
jgi:hypothetical protein